MHHLCILYRFVVSPCEEKSNSTLNWIQYNEKCYYASPDISLQWQSWQSAEAFCKQNGGFLVSIHSLSELRFITTKVSENILFISYSMVLNN